MYWKTALLIIIFYLLTLVQISFQIPFLVIIVILAISLIEEPKNRWGFVAAASGGLFLDIFSTSPLGFFGAYAVILVIISFFAKYILRKYIHIPKIHSRRKIKL